MIKAINILTILTLIFLFNGCSKETENNIDRTKTFPRGNDEKIIGKWLLSYIINNNKKMEFDANVKYSYIFKKDNTFKLKTKSDNTTITKSAFGIYNAQKTSTPKRLQLLFTKINNIVGPQKNEIYYLIYKISDGKLFLGINNSQPIELSPVENMQPSNFRHSLVFKKVS